MINRSKLQSSFLVLLMLGGCSRSPGAVAEVEREKKFQQMMSRVTLAGYSTRLDKAGLFGEERYRIDKVSKVAGDTWLFQARLKAGSREIPIPIPLTVLWAGDTPVITLTDLSIPGVGTYTARVLLYGEQYAGTWSGESAGGQLFGKIIREDRQ
jgi:hypothetical protein